MINNRNNFEWQLSDKIAHSEGTGERNKLKTARSGTTSDRNNFEYNNKHLGELEGQACRVAFSERKKI